MITQVANPSSIPSAVADYEAQNAHISAFNNIVNNQPFILTNSGGTGLPAIKLGTYIQYGGNLYVVDTGDYAITGTPVDGNNYIRLSGTTTLTAEWVQDVSSYVWNEVYGYKESGSYFLLPYLVVKSGTSYEKYSMGAVAVQYKMNQNVQSTDIVNFKSVLSKMNTFAYASTQNDWFDYFNEYIPNNNNFLLLSAIGEDFGNDFNIHVIGIKRTDSTTMTIYYHEPHQQDTLRTVVITDGSTSFPFSRNYMVYCFHN